MTKLEIQELRMLQALPIDVKILKTKQRIREWYDYWNKKVYISFSGGKDSTVLAVLAAEICKEMDCRLNLMFVDTGLEYPEVRKNTKVVEAWLKHKYSIDIELKMIRPEMRFDEVVKKYGWNFPSKDVAMTIHYARQGSRWAINRLDGLEKDGTEVKGGFKQRYKKWKYLLDAPFKISDKCCLVMKEKPLSDYEKETGNKPIIAIMADESERRKQSWLKTGCNSFNSDRPLSKPMSFWTEQDVLQYLKQYSVPYASVYGEIIYNKEGKLITTGEQRTGCMFCPTGCHLDKTNRFQRMQITHPKQWDYCMNELGLAKVLDYINVSGIDNLEYRKDGNGNSYQQYKIV